MSTWLRMYCSSPNFQDDVLAVALWLDAALASAAVSALAVRHGALRGSCFPVSVLPVRHGALRRPLVLRASPQPYEKQKALRREQHWHPQRCAATPRRSRPDAARRHGPERHDWPKQSLIYPVSQPAHVAAAPEWPGY